MRLQVRLTISDPLPADAGSRVRVTIVDTTRADTLHASVAESSIAMDASVRELELEISLPDDAVRAGHRYSLQAHVDHGGTGDIKPGDLIIMEDVAVPVVPRSAFSSVSARLRRV